MIAGGQGLRSVLQPLDLVAADGNWRPLVGDIDHPHKRRHAVQRPVRVIVRHDEVAPAADLERQRQRRVGRAVIGGRPVEPRNTPRLIDIVDVQDDEAGLPVAGVEPVAVSQRMVAPMGSAFPGLLLAACRARFLESRTIITHYLEALKISLILNTRLCRTKGP